MTPRPPRSVPRARCRLPASDTRRRSSTMAVCSLSAATPARSRWRRPPTPLSRSAELYDPAKGTFVATGSMSVGRAFHSATLLADGRVLIAGGHGALAMSSTEIFDPATGKFSPGDFDVSRPRRADGDSPARRAGPHGRRDGRAGNGSPFRRAVRPHHGCLRPDRGDEHRSSVRDSAARWPSPDDRIARVDDLR